MTLDYAPSQPSAPAIRRWIIIASVLIAVAGALFAIERAGVRVGWPWLPHGEIRRESRLFEQYGQFGSAVVIVLLIWQLDPPRRKLIPAVLITMAITGGVAAAMKHTIHRDRPSIGEVSDNGAGESQHASFPSGHSAAAAATAVVLAAMYPRGKTAFWSLAAVTAMLRYTTNAHWPSDVFAGLALGYLVGHVCWHLLVSRRQNPMPDDIITAVPVTHERVG